MSWFSKTPAEKQKQAQKRLFEAIENENLEKMKRAIAEGADVHQKGNGFTPLGYAACYGFTEGIKLLLSLNVDTNAAVSREYHPLVLACDRRRWTTARLLIEAGADVNCVNPDNGRTPLHYAAIRGEGGFVTWLLDKGANPTVRDQHMSTPADLAQKEYPHIASFIHERMPDLKPEQVAGWHITGPGEITHLTEKTVIGYRITEIFNFQSRVYTHITHNLSTHIDTPIVKPFGDLGELIDIAFKELESRDANAAASLGLKKPKAAGLRE